MNRECSCTASDLVSSPGLSILVYNTPAVRQSQLTFNAIQQLVGSIRVQFGQGLELCCVYVVFCVCVSRMRKNQLPGKRDETGAHTKRLPIYIQSSAGWRTWPSRLIIISWNSYCSTTMTIILSSISLEY